MENNQEMVQQNNQEAVQTSQPAQMQTPPQPQQPVRDPRTFRQYAFDKTFDAAGRELNRMEKEKPGTRRKMAGIASIGLGAGIGATGIGVGIYLLTS